MKKVFTFILTLSLLAAALPGLAASYDADAFNYLDGRAALVCTIAPQLGFGTPQLNRPEQLNQQAYLDYLEQIENAEKIIYASPAFNGLSAEDPLPSLETMTAMINDSAAQIAPADMEYLKNILDQLIAFCNLDNHVTLGKTFYFYTMLGQIQTLYAYSLSPAQYLQMMADDVAANCALITLPQNQTLSEFMQYASYKKFTADILQSGQYALQNVAPIILMYDALRATLLEKVIFGESAQAKMLMRLSEFISASDLKEWDLSEATQTALQNAAEWIAQQLPTDADAPTRIAQLEEILKNITIECNPWGKYGDVNGDGHIALTDVITLAKFVLNDHVPDADTLRRADLTEDGRLGLPDVIRLAQYVLSL